MPRFQISFCIDENVRSGRKYLVKDNDVVALQRYNEPPGMPPLSNVETGTFNPIFCFVRMSTNIVISVFVAFAVESLCEEVPVFLQLLRAI